jgi:hypothetical protein
MKHFLVILLLASGFYAAPAQPLAAYVDIQNEVMVFDRGLVHKVDFLAPTQMKIGRIAIPYLDDSRSFKIYYNGAVRNINIGFTNAFYTTDNMVVYLNQKSLNVFDKGVSKNLAGVCDQYFYSDSVVLFLDSYKGEYRAYYNGQITTVESFIPDSVLANLKVASNIIAFDNFANQFRIFWRGSLIAQEEYPVSSFDVGKNTVAYVDADRKFKIFHNGQTYIIDDFPPMTYKAAGDMVAFVSNDGYFKIFYGDSVRTIGFMNPQFKAVENVIAYQDPNGTFKVFYKGDITEMETYIPSKYQVKYNSVAYVNASGTLRLFSEGEVYDVTNADLQNWELHYDVITYQIGQGMFKIFYKGQEY